MNKNAIIEVNDFSLIYAQYKKKFHLNINYWKVESLFFLSNEYIIIIILLYYIICWTLAREKCF